MVPVLSTQVDRLLTERLRVANDIRVCQFLPKDRLLSSAMGSNHAQRHTAGLGPFVAQCVTRPILYQ